MKLAVIGAWGYLGANLLELSEACGISRKSSAERRPFLKEAFKNKEIYLIDEITEEVLKEILERCEADVVVYAAGKLKGSYEEMYDSHVRKALVSLRASKELGLRFVYVSSVAAMGLADKCVKGGTVVEEEEHLKGCEPLGNYSKTKAEGEKKVRELGGGIVRPALIVGKWAYHFEWKVLEKFKELGLPVPNVSTSSVRCIIKGIEKAAREPSWYITVDGTLRDYGFRAVDVRVPTFLIKALRPFSLALLPLRYRYGSERLRC